MKELGEENKIVEMQKSNEIESGRYLTKELIFFFVAVEFSHHLSKAYLKMAKTLFCLSSCTGREFQVATK